MTESRGEGEVVRLKRLPRHGGDDAGDRLVRKVEEILLATNTRDKSAIWKWRKKVPRERSDLIILARNLYDMLASLPHGRKTQALSAAGFGGAEQSGYLGNLTVPPYVVEVSGDRLRRLTPVVGRYLEVALAITSDRAEAIAGLFRGTSLDNAVEIEGATADWADRLARNLSSIAAKVDAKEQLAILFDRLSASNVHIDGGPELRLLLTDWLSETFHKFDFSGSGGRWLFDRNDENTPLCGAPLFCPKVALASDKREWTFDVISLSSLSGEELAHPTTISIHAVSTLFLALVPIARDLDTPCSIAAWILERPEAVIVEPELDQIWRILESDVPGGPLGIWSAAGKWSVSAPTHSIDDASAALFLERQSHQSDNPDLNLGCWWCAPANPENVRRLLGVTPELLLLAPAIRPKPGGRMVEAGASWDDIDLHAVDPSVFAPWQSTAASLQHVLAAGELETRFADEIQRISRAYNAMRRELCEAWSEL